MQTDIRLKEITRVYRFAIRKRSWERAHSAEDHFIAYRLFGKTIHEYGGQELEFKRDTLMIANSEDLYRVTQHEFASEGAKGGCIAIHFTTEAPFSMHMSVYDCTACPQIKSEFFRILNTWNQRGDGADPQSDYKCISIFYSILSLLAAPSDEKGASGGADARTHRAEAAEDYLSHNFADSGLSISDAADAVGLSTRRLNELFRSHFHVTPGKYLTNLRLRHACRLLKDSSLSVCDIAVLCGFTSSSYFIRVFHREIGISPAAYRRLDS